MRQSAGQQDEAPIHNPVTATRVEQDLTDKTGPHHSPQDTTTASLRKYQHQPQNSGWLQSRIRDQTTRRNRTHDEDVAQSTKDKAASQPAARTMPGYNGQVDNLYCLHRMDRPMKNVTTIHNLECPSPSTPAPRRYLAVVLNLYVTVPGVDFG